MRWAASITGLALIACVQLPAAVPQCATCHPKEAEAHAQTRMAHALMPVLQSAFARNLPNHPLSESNGGYLFDYRVMDKGIAVTAVRGLDEAQGFIRWVIGAGEQGQTPLVETREGIAQHRVSYFPQLHQYGITVGDDPGASANAEAALGRTWNKRDLRDCLNCHATSVSSDLKSFTPGIQCLKCHPGANEHALGHGSPFNPGRVGAEAQVRFCGQCHRVEAAPNGNALETIRFQPLRLMKSKCFASGKLSCTTCHLAHQDALRNDPDYYNGKCMGCHAGLPHVRQQQAGNCIGCHMPEVQLGNTLRFTDHDIHVVKAGARSSSLDGMDSSARNGVSSSRLQRDESRPFESSDARSRTIERCWRHLSCHTPRKSALSTVSMRIAQISAIGNEITGLGCGRRSTSYLCSPNCYTACTASSRLSTTYLPSAYQFAFMSTCFH